MARKGGLSDGDAPQGPFVSLCDHEAAKADDGAGFLYGSGREPHSFQCGASAFLLLLLLVLYFSLAFSLCFLLFFEDDAKNRVN